jgi:hypothetical protein
VLLVCLHSCIRLLICGVDCGCRCWIWIVSPACHWVVFRWWHMLILNWPASRRHNWASYTTNFGPESGDSIFLRNIENLDQFRTMPTPKNPIDINRSVSSGVTNSFLFAGHEGGCSAVPWRIVCGKHAWGVWMRSYWHMNKAPWGTETSVWEANGNLVFRE